MDGKFLWGVVVGVLGVWAWHQFKPLPRATG